MSFSASALQRALIAVLGVLAAARLPAADMVDPADSTPRVDFQRDVYPILVKRCHECHGPDEQEGRLRLDASRMVLHGGESGPALVKGNGPGSLLIQRISSTDNQRRMPPEGEPLSTQQIATLRAWIDRGANWPAGVGVDVAPPKPHWAYVKPRRPALPDVSQPQWVRNAIDAFVLARLDREKLTPSPPAQPARLLRRVYLDLVGRPPSVAEVDALLADPSPAAYERMVDRLLASKAYGVRWARPWLDAARYADSNGYQADQYRSVWPYRDWVIDAMNADVPFDQFTIEQLAGDLLPGASVAQRIATGFHRSTTCNVEAGVDPEENRVNQIIDRVNTTGTVWLGTTVQCGQCHDHKYDPLTQDDYYALLAFFNNTPLEVKHTSATTYDFYGPKLEIPSPAGKKSQQDKPAAKRTEKKTAQKKQPANRPGRATTLVMVEMDKPRNSFVFRRGNFLDKGRPVQPATPRSLHPMRGDLPRDRLGLARWLVDADNPLTPRVTVNRWWQEIFGRGIVSTAEDFGTRGEPPTHPRLLDWLAVELVESGWSRKHIHKLIVTSATYQQSSRVTPELLARDPYNKLLARGGRFRLSAETIRDNLLAISGLLSEKQGGPPIYPPQPAGIWRHVGRNAPKYATSTGEDRFRRGIYVVWRRSAPYPSFVNFDAPDRASCVVNRPRTNTPLQALTLMNDPAYVEMALALARRMAADRRGESVDRRVEYGFRLSVSRRPKDREREHLAGVYQRELSRLQKNPQIVAKMLGNERIPDGVTRAELAAWFYVANILLNLDETITKG